MKFELLPIIDTMLDLYEKPRSFERFNSYILALQGETKGDLSLPISGFNPMAKEHVIKKLKALKSIDAEGIMKNSLAKINETVANKKGELIIKFVLNLADDAAGGWTNKYTTDFDSKFKLNALVSRNFCTPFFWTSEVFSVELIQKRTQEYIYRTLYWLENTKPKTLKNFVVQEVFVAQKAGCLDSKYKTSDFEEIAAFYAQNADSEDYSLIFNFFYGDVASKSLGFSTFGFSEKMNGFEFVKLLAR